MEADRGFGRLGEEFASDAGLDPHIFLLGICFLQSYITVYTGKDQQPLNGRLHHLASPKTISVLATAAPPRRWGDGAKRKVGPLSLSYVSYGVQLSTTEEWAAASKVV